MGEGERPEAPDFWPNVLVFEPTQINVQEQVDNVFHEQERAQFGSGRYALLFKPGHYELNVEVGFYTHVAGLGRIPEDVVIEGAVRTDAAWMNRNATCNFWRSVENLTIIPRRDRGAMMWAVSQAAPMRRTLIRGDLHLSSGGWSSGGFLADCRIDGDVVPGSQQQWFSRNCQWRQWNGGNWNMVFAGCVNPPAGEWPARPFTVVAETPVIREKPYLFVDEDGRWCVRVPPLSRQGTVGLTWEDGQSPGDVLSIERFHIAKPDSDTAATINAALRAGENILFTPGIYSLDDTIVVSRESTVILGLGFPSLTPTGGKPAMLIEAGEGVIVSGVIFDASSRDVETLLQIGLPDGRSGDGENPICLHDVFCRVGGYGPGKAKCMVTIYDDDVIGDNLWLWRADHGRNVGWSENTCDTGLRVEGDNVTIYGLFVEHTQRHQTVWNGDGGRVIFYQSEMPYDPPSQEAWQDEKGTGFASYKVGDHVKTHQACGLGVYHVFRGAPVIAENAFETPTGPKIKMQHMITFRLGGGKPGSGIRHVINGRGGSVIDGQKATVD
ncbi:MAG: coagulation factor 5/8 type domain-containing protein [Phycisphaerales bacterium]|nr:MAG: coagulation factor 5/8 type domain-containing protein [Phycisphaerales bacterium]